MSVARSEAEIDDQLNKAAEGIEHGSRWLGMSYEAGVDAAIRWILGWTDDKPMEDE